MGYKTFKFKVYRNRRRNAFLQKQIESFASPYNHMLAMEDMRRLWGRKVSDLGFADFLTKLTWVAHKHGKEIVQIDSFFPSSKMCCGTVKKDLELRDRVFKCDCGWTCDRDLSAARNIHEVGKTTFAGETVRRLSA